MKKKILHASVYVDPNEIVSHLVGLKEVRVLSYARRGPAGEITVEQANPVLKCPKCRRRAWVKDRPVVSYVDLPFGGVPMTLRWKKHRLFCPNPRCRQRSFTLGDHRISAVGCMLTTRAAKWVVKQVGGGQTIAHLAGELACDWDAVNVASRIYGQALLAADTKRLKDTTAIGLDERLFVRQGPYKVKTWSTTVCDVANHALIDVLPTRDFTEVASWMRAQPHHVKERLEYGCLDMSRTYNAVFRVVTPKATRVIDRFHVMRHAILAVDQTDAGSNNSAWAIGAGPGTRSIGPASSWSSGPRPAIPSSKNASRDSWPWATPTARWRSPRASKKPWPSSTPRKIPRRPPTCCATSSSSPPSAPLPSRCSAWRAPCATGSNPSWPGTRPRCPTVPPKA